MHTKPNAQPNRSLIDGMATLQALAISPEPIGCRELARRLGFDTTRVNRLLRTLAYLGIARQTANRKYTSGPGMHVLAAQSLFASGLVHNALPALERLRRFGHTVAMGVLWRDNVSYLFHAPPGIAAAAALGRIGLFPATSGGIGLALLAEMDDEDVTEIYKDRDIPRFPDGLPSLLAKLAEIRRDSFVYVKVRDDRDQNTVAITIGSPPHSAIGISGWIPQPALDEILQALRVAAEEIETGGPADAEPSSPALPDGYHQAV